MSKERKARTIFTVEKKLDYAKLMVDKKKAGKKDKAGKKERKKGQALFYFFN